MEGAPNFYEKLDAGEARRPEYGPLWLDLKSRTLHMAGSDAVEYLDPQQYQVLWMLVRAHGNPLNEADFLDFLDRDIPDDKDVPLSNRIAVRIHQLRAKVKKLAGDSVIINNNLRGGYSIELKK